MMNDTKKMKISTCTVSMTLMPPFSRMDLVLKFVWAPAPFQSPFTGLGSSVAEMSQSSAMR